MTAYIPVFQSSQKVQYTEMNDPFNNLYNNIDQLYSNRTLPIIISGLGITIDSGGTVTAQAGVVVSDPYTDTDDALLPASGVNVYATLDSSDTVAVTASGAEYGWILLQEILTPINGTTAGGGSIVVGFTITTSLVYQAGSSSAYPVTRPPHSTILAGVITTGTGPFNYQLDFGQRNEDDTVNQQTIRESHLLSEPNISTYFADNPEIITAGTTVQLSNNWYGVVDSDSNTTNFSPVTLTLSQAQTMPNSPITAISISRSATTVTGSEGLRQPIKNIDQISNKWITLSLETYLLSASTTIDIVLRVVQNDVVIYTTPETIPISVMAGFQLSYKSFYIPSTIFSTLTNSDTFALDVVVYAPTTAYTIQLTQIYIVSGDRFYLPSSPLIDQNSFTDPNGASRIETISGKNLQILSPAVLVRTTSSAGTPITYDADQAINIASVTHPDAGEYVVTYANPLKSATYTPFATVLENYPVTISVTTMTANGCTIRTNITTNNAAWDTEFTLMILEPV